MKFQKCWFSATAREVRRELGAFITSEKTKGFNKPLGCRTDTQQKPRPNQHICDWWPCPAQRTHGWQQHPESHLPTPSIPCTGAHLGSESHPGTSLPLQPCSPWAGDGLFFQLFTRARKPWLGTCHWNTHAYGWFIPHVLASMEQTYYSRAPSQAEANACGTCRICTFPAAKGQMSSLDGSAGPSFSWPRAVSSGEDVARSRGAGLPPVPPRQRRKCYTPSEPRNE